MKVKQLKSDKNEIKLLIEGSNASFVNALRRAINFEVPVLAIEDVYFTKNDSALYDEIIAHRLGLIPLTTDLKGYNFKDKCTCKTKGCAKCQVKLSLATKGPGMVYAKDLKSSDPSIKPVHPDTPIVLLGDKQELQFEAIAILGHGREHIKWSSALSYYQRYPKITLPSKNPKVAEGVKHCPKKVFDTSKVKITNLEACDLCLACVDYSDKQIKVEGVPGKFIFTLESWGQLAAKNILAEASTILASKAKELKI